MTKDERVGDLLHDVSTRSGDLSDACMKLGLLMERFRLREASSRDHNWNRLLSESLLKEEVTEHMVQQIVRILIAYVESVDEIDTAAIWALEKSYSPDVVPVLVDVLAKCIGDAARHTIAHQALHTVIICGLTLSTTMLPLHVCTRRWPTVLRS